MIIVIINIYHVTHFHKVGLLASLLNLKVLSFFNFNPIYVFFIFLMTYTIETYRVVNYISRSEKKELGPGIAWDSGRNGDLGDACSPPWGAERTVCQSGWALFRLSLLQSSPEQSTPPTPALGTLTSGVPEYASCFWSVAEVRAKARCPDPCRQKRGTEWGKRWDPSPTHTSPSKGPLGTRRGPGGSRGSTSGDIHLIGRLEWGGNEGWGRTGKTWVMIFILIWPKYEGGECLTFKISCFPGEYLIKSKWHQTLTIC